MTDTWTLDSHRLSPDALARQQARRLIRLIADNRAANSFYRDRLPDTDPPEDPQAAWRWLETLPFTTKTDLISDQQAYPPFGRNRSEPLHRYVRYSQTSATTGTPLRWLDTARDWARMGLAWQHIFHMAGVAAGDRVFFAFSFGPFLGFWTAFDAAANLGALAIPGGGLSSQGRLRTIVDTGTTVLCCTPTYAIRLGEAAAEAGIDPGKLPVRAIVVAGEPGGSIPAVYSHIETLWPGARVYDHHGMTEVGPVSYECPAERGRLHVMESAFWPEVVTPDGGKRLDVPGTGELVLTTLGRSGSPLLRYRTGDLVEVPAPPTPDRIAGCACGSVELTLLGGILGRADDMVSVRGVNIYPGAIERLVRGHGGVAEYRVEIWRERGMSEMRLLIEPLAEVGDVMGLVERLSQEVRGRLSLRVPVVAVGEGTLPRFEMKARRWVRLEAPPEGEGGEGGKVGG